MAVIFVLIIQLVLKINNMEYYLEKQIIPALENIFQVFNVDVKKMIGDGKQKTLGDF